MTETANIMSGEPNLNMTVDVLGRIRNTSVPYKHAFIPLFEAVVNSIQSTSDRFGEAVGTEGHVEVHIERVAPELMLTATVGRPPVPAISKIKITDNGQGFTDNNLMSFITADSTAKAALGGKGVGRFTWLVVFETTKIVSVVTTSEGQRESRSFTFAPTSKGIEHFSVVETTSDISTSVTLDTVKHRFAEALRMGADAVADRLFEHCFNYFVLGHCPVITLTEDGPDGLTSLTVNDRLNEMRWAGPTTLTVGGHQLEVLHVQRKVTSGGKHEAHLCANHRVVESFNLADHCDLSSDPYRSAEGEAVFHQAFVSGGPLDQAVDSTRTRLDLPDGLPLLERAGALDLRTLRAQLGAQVDDQLSDILQAERQENFNRIENQIRTELPEYGPLLRRKRERLEKLRWSSDRRKMDESLYRIHQELEAEVRGHQAEIEQLLDQTDEVELAEITEQLERVIFDTNEVGQMNLVKYVIKRRAVLKLLTKLVSHYDGQALEEQIHRTVFPMRRTGDEIALGEHNLWLVDDTLAFYEFLTSDLRFSDNEGAPSDSGRRPDILAVKRGDPYDHVAIVEFKRPDRSDSDPVQQLKEYAQLLRQGGEVDVNNIPLPPIDRTVRIDGFAVVTLTERMRKRLEFSDLQPVPREERWHGYHQNLNLSLEVMDFRAFIRRAEQRNRAFFTKLSLL